MPELRISSALGGSLHQLQNAPLGGVRGNKVKPFPVPNEITEMVLSHAVERDSGFALASRGARELYLENAIGVVRDSLRSGGCPDSEARRARDAYHFLRKVVFAAVATDATAAAGEQETSHGGCVSARLSAAVGLMAASARHVLERCVVAAEDVSAVGSVKFSVSGSKR